MSTFVYPAANNALQSIGWEAFDTRAYSKARKRMPKDFAMVDRIGGKGFSKRYFETALREVLACEGLDSAVASDSDVKAARAYWLATGEASDDLRRDFAEACRKSGQAFIL